jgi:hypothetical protein
MQGLNLLRYIAQVYVVVCLIESLFGPIGNYIFFENYLFIPAFGFASFVLLKDKKSRVFTALFISIFVWIVISDYIAHEKIVMSHLLYALRWIKYPVVFLIINDAVNNQQSIKALKNTLIFIFLTLCIINLVLLINPWQLGETIQFFFSPKSDFLLSNYYEPGIYRLSGTMTNPNDNAVVFGLFFLFFYLNKEHKDLYYSLIALTFVLFTQSRTVLILLLLFVVTHFVIKQLKTRSLNFIPLLGIVIGFLFLIVGNSSYIKTIFTGEAFASNSFRIRIENLIEITKANNTDLILGQGYAANQVEKFGRYLDSEIISFIAQFGIIGLLIWLGLICTSVFYISKHYTTRIVWISFFLLFMGISLTNNSFLNIQTSILFVFLLGFSSVYKGNDFCKHDSYKQS